MQNYTEHFSVKVTPQTQPIPGKNMVENNAGGFSFSVDKKTKLDRFLILGTSGGSYYASEKKMTVETAKDVIELIKIDGTHVVNRTVEISFSGRAIKNDPALFVLALCTAFGNDATKKLAYASISKICRTGTHLFNFCEYVNNLRGWSRGLRKAVANWYVQRDIEKLGTQVTKYRQRDGWEHRDVLRLSHPKVKNDENRNELFKYIVGKEYVASKLPKSVSSFLEVQKETDEKKVIELINENNFSWEMLPTNMLSSKKIWESLIPSLGITALIRNLGKLSALGLLESNLGDITKFISTKLADVEEIKKGRVHPFQYLLATKAYGMGRGIKGSLMWTVNSRIQDALEAGFYAGFATITPSNKDFIIGLDASSSMMSSLIANSFLSAREASAALVIQRLRTEPNVEVLVFCDKVVPVKGLKKTDSLSEVIKKTNLWTGGSTNCAAPMEWALANKVKADAFDIYTDNETYIGGIHPSQALIKCRKIFNNSATFAVVGMVTNDFTIADPKDSGMMDFVGFDSNIPLLLNQFHTGQI